MEKWKRSARLTDMIRQLLFNPYRLIPLTVFAEKYKAAKSSISEDLDIIDEVLRSEGNGKLETVAVWRRCPLYSGFWRGTCPEGRARVVRKIIQSRTHFAGRLFVSV